MVLKRLLLPILALQFSCSYKPVENNVINGELSIVNRRALILDGASSAYRFESNKDVIKFKKRQSLVAPADLNLFYPDYKINKPVIFKKLYKIKPIRIVKKLLTNSQDFIVTNNDSEKLIHSSGKTLKINEQTKINNEIDMSKNFKKFAFDGSRVELIESFAHLSDSINWDGPKKAQEIANLNLKNLELNNTTTDSLKVVSSAVEKNIPVDKDDFVFIDLNSESEKNEGSSDDLASSDVASITEKPLKTSDEASFATSTKVDSLSKLFKASSISSNVQNAIKRATLNLSSTKPRKTKKYIPSKPVLNSQSVDPSSGHGFLADLESECSEGAMNSKMTIHGYSVKIGVERSGKVFNYDFLPEYNRDELISDRGQGCLNISNDIITGSTLRGTFSSRDEVATKVDAYIDGNSLFVPLIDTTSLEKFLEDKKDYTPGGFVLIEVAENISSVELATEYGKKYFFNEFFVETDNDDFQFVLFSGVAIGNTKIQYLTNDDHIVDRIAHIVENEIYFDLARIENSKTELFYLFEDGMFSKNRKLMIDGNQIRFFNSDIFAKQKALNLFEIQTPPTAKGMRKYFELNHLGEVIVLGKEKQKRVSLPTRRLIGQILSEMNVEDLSGRCMIQLNTRKSVKEIQVAGETKSGAMNLNYQFLDADGNFGISDSDSVTKIFITGENQGVINAKIDFFDGKSRIIQTYCSQETYLVEQL